MNNDCCAPVNTGEQATCAGGYYPKRYGNDCFFHCCKAGAAPAVSSVDPSTCVQSHCTDDLHDCCAPTNIGEEATCAAGWVPQRYGDDCWFKCCKLRGVGEAVAPGDGTLIVDLNSSVSRLKKGGRRGLPRAAPALSEPLLWLAAAAAAPRRTPFRRSTITRAALPRRNADLTWMRYWTLAEGYLWARGQKDNQNNHASFYYGAFAVDLGGGNTRPGHPTRVTDDGGIAGTLGVRTIGGTFYGIGGEAFDDKILDAPGANPPYDDQHHDARDGIYLLPFGTVASALSGDWRDCCHGSWRQARAATPQSQPAAPPPPPLLALLFHRSLLSSLTVLAARRRPRAAHPDKQARGLPIVPREDLGQRGALRR